MARVTTRTRKATLMHTALTAIVHKLWTRSANERRRRSIAERRDMAARMNTNGGEVEDRMVIDLDDENVRLERCEGCDEVFKVDEDVKEDGMDMGV